MNRCHGEDFEQNHVEKAKRFLLKFLSMSMKQATGRKAMENMENTQPKFSPGPWRVESHALEHQVIVDADGHYVCGSSFRPAVERPRARANAKLAAAAPEMYALLERVIREGGTRLDIADEILKLLAKARGEELK